MTRNGIIAIATAAVLGAAVLTATAVPALSGGHQRQAAWHQTMYGGAAGPSMMSGAQDPMSGAQGSMGGWQRGMMRGRTMPGGMMGTWSR
ncbi:MAG: hypothetical protein U0237_15715 [Thermoleophilia bacterium]